MRMMNSVGETAESPFIPSEFQSSSANSCAISANYAYNILKADGELCFGCGGYIVDRYLLQTNGQSWHASCLRCTLCTLSLEQFPSCFVKDDRAYCKPCYTREFGIKCGRCGRVIQSTDWVRRARRLVYHLACFACDSCKRQLSTGEEFALQDGRILCKQHYMELMDGETGHHKRKTKRVRTTFTEEQLQVLQANFQVDSNPDGQDLERIAQITGLSKRVTQVWFQNSRARQKKYQGMKKSGLLVGSDDQGVGVVGAGGESMDVDGSEEGSTVGDHLELSPGPVSDAFASYSGEEADNYDVMDSVMC